MLEKVMIFYDKNDMYTKVIYDCELELMYVIKFDIHKVLDKSNGILEFIDSGINIVSDLCDYVIKNLRCKDSLLYVDFEYKYDMLEELENHENGEILINALNEDIEL